MCTLADFRQFPPPPPIELLAFLGGAFSIYFRKTRNLSSRIYTLATLFFEPLKENK
jgi:hypothetical protein